MRLPSISIKCNLTYRPRQQGSQWYNTISITRLSFLLQMMTLLQICILWLSLTAKLSPSSAADPIGKFHGSHYRLLLLLLHLLFTPSHSFPRQQQQLNVLVPISVPLVYGPCVPLLMQFIPLKTRCLSHSHPTHPALPPLLMSNLIGSGGKQRSQRVNKKLPTKLHCHRLQLHY